GAHLDGLLAPVKTVRRDGVFEGAAPVRRFRHEVGAVAVGNRAAGEFSVDVEVDGDRRINARVARPAADRTRAARVDHADQWVAQTPQEFHASPRGASKPLLADHKISLNESENLLSPR